MTCAARVVATLATGLCVAGSAGATVASPATAQPCRGRDLGGTFAAVRGSAGAGQITYLLRLWNRSSHVCFVSGQPGLRLQDRSGRPLPTHVQPQRPGEATAALVLLRPRGFASATARFSPDVPGVGEGTIGACERTAYAASVAALGGGSVRVPVEPPTPVCEHGRMLLSLYTASP